MAIHDSSCGLCRIEMDNVTVRRGHSVLLSDVSLHLSLIHI